MVDTVEYWLEATINTGNFENLKPGARIVTAVREGEHPKAALTRAAAVVEEFLEQKIDEARKD